MDPALLRGGHRIDSGKIDRKVFYLYPYHTNPGKALHKTLGSAGFSHLYPGCAIRKSFRYWLLHQCMQPL
jgi:hypothetical protein